MNSSLKMNQIVAHLQNIEYLLQRYLHVMFEKIQSDSGDGFTGFLT